MKIGVWVTAKHGKPGWLEEVSGQPFIFKSVVEAKEWIKDNTVHKQYYEPKTFKEDLK